MGYVSIYADERPLVHVLSGGQAWVTTSRGIVAVPSHLEIVKVEWSEGMAALMVTLETDDPRGSDDPKRPAFLGWLSVPLKRGPVSAPDVPEAPLYAVTC